MTKMTAIGGEARGRGSLPSVLAVTSELPWPLDSGGHLRTYHLLKALARRFRVRLVTAAGPGPGIEALHLAGIETCSVSVAPRSRWREILRAANAAAAGQPYVLYRRHDRGEVRAALRYQLVAGPPDVLYFDHLDSFAFQDLRPRMPFVIDLHNVCSTLARRSAREQNSFWLRAYLRRESRLLERIERRAAPLASRLLAVSKDDGQFFERLGGLSPSIVPNGVDCDAYRELPTGRRCKCPVILYVGVMSWAPNASAAEFLAKDTLPRVRDRFPGAILRVVGREPSPSVVALGRIPGVEVTGSVPDMIPHLRDASLLAVPLDAGGGTRLKILEAFAAGLPVLSTAVGCEGLDVAHEKHLLVAERERFAEGVETLLGDPALGERLADVARQFARERYDWKIIGEAACEAVMSVVREP